MFKSLFSGWYLSVFGTVLNILHCSGFLCIIILHFMMKQFASWSCLSALCSAASFLSDITEVNLCSGLHGSSISRIIFCLSWQFCVFRVMGVCFGIRIAIEHIHDVYIIGQQPVLWFTAVHMFVLLTCYFWFIFLISCWLPVSTWHGSTNEQTAVQLFSSPPLTRGRWERLFTFRYDLKCCAVQALHTSLASASL